MTASESKHQNYRLIKVSNDSSTPNPQHEIRSPFINKIRAPAPLTWMWTKNSWKPFFRSKGINKTRYLASSLNLVFYEHFSRGSCCNWKAKSAMPLHNCTALSSAPKCRDDLINWNVGKLTIAFKHLNHKLKLCFLKNVKNKSPFFLNKKELIRLQILFFLRKLSEALTFENGFYPQ